MRCVPGAVVVHSLDAEVAGRAVVDALELVVVALAADRHHPTLPALDLPLRCQLLERHHVLPPQKRKLSGSGEREDMRVVGRGRTRGMTPGQVVMQATCDAAARKVIAEKSAQCT